MHSCQGGVRAFFILNVVHKVWNIHALLEWVHVHVHTCKYSVKIKCCLLVYYNCFIDLTHRNLDVDERRYLVGRGVVSEIQSNMGEYI